MDSDQILLHAINLIEAGNKTDGRELLRQTVQAEPYNPDAWYIYAQYCGKRDQAVYAIEQVLKLEPDYPGAREALTRIAPDALPPIEQVKPQPAFVPLEKDDPWVDALRPDANAPAIVPGKIVNKKKKNFQAPKWFIAATASMLGCLFFACLGISALALVNHPGFARTEVISSPVENIIPVTGNTPEPTFTAQPYRPPTATPDPCTCEAVETYMSAHLARVNQLLAEMDTVKNKLNQKGFQAQDAAILTQNASKMYETQRAEQAPPCLESYQKEAVKLFWTWQQATTSIQNKDINGALAFIEIIASDSQQLERKLEKLSSYPSLQVCHFALPTLAAP